MLHAMIMAGGGGTRFWPRSRQARPKQFLTLQRRPHAAAGHGGPHRRAGAAGAARGSSPAASTAPRPSSSSRAAGGPQVVGEPCGRDTAAVHRPRGGAHRPRRPRRDDHGHAGRPRHRAGAGVPPGRPRRRAVRRRLPRLRCSPSASSRRSPRTGYGYIHAASRPARGRACSVCSVHASSRRSPTPATAERVRRLRRVLLEQRHLRLEAGDDPGRTRAPQARAARDRRAHRRGLGHAARARGVPRPSTSRPRRSASTSR